MKDEDFMPEKDWENMDELEDALDKCIAERKQWCAKAMEAANDRLNWQNRAIESTKQINELSLLVHRLCKEIEDNFIEGKPLDIKKAEEARNYIIRHANIKNVLR